MKKAAIRKSIKGKIVGIILLSIFFITAVLGWFSFEFSKRRIVSMLGDSIKSLALTIAAYVPERDISLIASNTDALKKNYSAEFMPPSLVYAGAAAFDQGQETGTLSESAIIYNKYARLLSDIKKMNEIDSPINIYKAGSNRLKLVVTSEPVFMIGSTYEIRPEAREALESGRPASTGIYSDKDGVWISAYAPIPGSGSAASGAVVEVSYRINSYVARLRYELAIIVAACLALFAAASVLSYRRVEKFVMAIRRLDEAAARLGKGDYDTAVDVSSDDEIGRLAETFEAMRTAMREKVDELRMSLVREKRAHLESIVALTNAIEMRDPYTRRHLYRVEKYALLIAKGLKLSHADMETLRYACFLHDIGKIYTEESLLKKIDLSQSEITEIRRHSERGAKLIEGIRFLEDVKDAVLSHQERYDGKGYPAGLKGDDIPMLARIIQVADAFDAMTTDRPYRKAMSFADALKEIEVNSGTQFDPKVADAFLKYKDELQEIAQRHFEK